MNPLIHQPHRRREALNSPVLSIKLLKLVVMAPNISNYTSNLIVALLTAGYSYRRITIAIRVDALAMRRIKRHLRITSKARLNGISGPARCLNREELKALLYRLVEKPELYQDKMCWFV